MAEGNRIQNFVVGSVFLGGILLMGLATLLVRGVPWAEAQTLNVRFPSVNNLNEGEHVVVHGLRVGEVSKIRLDPDPRGNVLVHCKLYEEVPLTTTTEFHVRSAGPLGGRYLEIIPNGGAARAGDWDGFVGRSDGDVFEQIGKLVEQSHNGRGLLSKLIQDEEFADKTEKAVDEIRVTFASVNEQFSEGKGLVGRLFHDAELAGKFEQAVIEFGTTFRALNSSEGELMKEGSLITDVRQLFKDAREQKGILGMIISDSEARDELRETITEIKKIVDEIGEEEGLLWRLLNDERLSERVDEIMTDVHDIVHKANSGEGTLGQLVNNREAWDELMRILVLARESIEDLREQAPINTFANVLFAVF